MKRKLVSALITACVAVMSVGSAAAFADTVKIGVYEPASGDNGAGGKQEVLGMQYANSIAPTVEIGGATYDVELDIVDNESSNDKGPSAASKLVGDGVSVVLGSYGSGVSIAASDIFKDGGVPAIGVTCTNPQVTQGNTHYFRICFLDPFQGSVLANFASETFGAKKAYCLAKLGDDYSQGLVFYFTKAFEALGGEVVKDYPNAGAWAPTSLVPRKDGTKGPFPHFIDRGKPGVIAVSRAGRRFVNEANSYHDFVQGMECACPSDQPAEAFLIADHRTIRKYGLGHVKPAPLPLQPSIRSGYLMRGNTLAELASVAGIERNAFEETVARWNADVTTGTDTAFGKGSTAYNRFHGDPEVKPNPCLAPIATGPFYAVRVVPGDIGTFAGLKTDEHARVIGPDNTPLKGLYAVGNDMASVLGGNYSGGGITLGPGMTFGYIAGLHAASERN